MIWTNDSDKFAKMKIIDLKRLDTPQRPSQHLQSIRKYLMLWSHTGMDKKDFFNLLKPLIITYKEKNQIYASFPMDQKFKFHIKGCRIKALFFFLLIVISKMKWRVQRLHLDCSYSLKWWKFDPMNFIRRQSLFTIFQRLAFGAFPHLL